MDNYLGEIRLFAFAKAPNGWVACNGQLLQVTTNQALFALLGNRYGGDGKTTFGVPDLRGRVPLQLNSQFAQGTAAGTETVALTTAQLPAHNHSVSAYNTAGNTGALASGYPAQVASPSITPAPPPAPNMYGPVNTPVVVDPASVGSSGASSTTPAAHENRQPTIAMNYCIATLGLFPSRY